MRRGGTRQWTYSGHINVKIKTVTLYNELLVPVIIL